MRIGALLKPAKSPAGAGKHGHKRNSTSAPFGMSPWTIGAHLKEHDPIAWRPEQSINATLLEEFPSRIELIAFDMRKYAAWIKGRKDSMHLRAQWLTEVAGIRTDFYNHRCHS